MISEIAIFGALKLSNTPDSSTDFLTSPLTETIHFDEALFLYNNGKYDSILTCVRNYRFFWNEDGTSRNYDFKKRPRRQDFSGILMENGAFYISKVENILKSGNRLSGKIGI